jgi:hypothetical protein
MPPLYSRKALLHGSLKGEQNRARGKVSEKSGERVSDPSPYVFTGGDMRGTCTDCHLAYEVRDWWHCRRVAVWGYQPRDGPPFSLLLLASRIPASTNQTLILDTYISMYVKEESTHFVIVHAPIVVPTPQPLSHKAS